MTPSRTSRRGAGGWRSSLRGAAALATLVLVGLWAFALRRSRRRAAVVAEPRTSRPGAAAAPQSDAGAGPRTSRFAGVRRLASVATMLGLVTLWAITLRPDGLGGPAAYVFVSGTSMEPGLATGDLVIARRQRSYERGDVIAYRVPDSNALVIHRIVGGSAEAGYKTRGDNREGNDVWTPKPDEIRGRQIFTIRQGGKAVALLGQPLPLAILAGALAFTGVGGPLRRS